LITFMLFLLVLEWFMTAVLMQLHEEVSAAWSWSFFFFPPCSQICIHRMKHFLSTLVNSVYLFHVSSTVQLCSSRNSDMSHPIACSSVYSVPLLWVTNCSALHFSPSAGCLQFDASPHCVFLNASTFLFIYQ
jgi:hypothetical protein